MNTLIEGRTHRNASLLVTLIYITRFGQVTKRHLGRKALMPRRYLTYSLTMTSTPPSPPLP